MASPYYAIGYALPSHPSPQKEGGYAAALPHLVATPATSYIRYFQDSILIETDEPEEHKDDAMMHPIPRFTCCPIIAVAWDFDGSVLQSSLHQSREHE